MIDLTLRPAHNDHRVLGDLIANGIAGWSGRSRPLFDRIVLDATIAAGNGQLALDAAGAGVPVLVDPMTYLLQYDTSGHGWSTLPIGEEAAIGGAYFDSATTRKDYVARTVDFQIGKGASAIVPPYFYASGPRDPLFSHNLTAIRATRDYLDSAGLNFAVVPVFCGRVDAFSHPDSWPQGLDWFTQVSRDCGADDLAIQLSPVGDFTDNYAKLFHFFRTVQRAQASGLRTHVWRQGALGRALVAAGAAGYETGLQYGNKTNIASLGSSRRITGVESRGGGGGGQIFLSSLGRWVAVRQATEVRKHPSVRDVLLCDDPINCCPGGYGDTLENRRQHAVRSHSRGLESIRVMPPNVPWRMHQIAKENTEALDSLGRINKVLERAGTNAIARASHEALVRIAEDLSRLASAAA